MTSSRLEVKPTSKKHSASSTPKSRSTSGISPLARPINSGANAVAVSPRTGDIYVANSSDRTVSVINGRTGTVTSTISVGFDPVGVAVSPRTGKTYVTNYEDGTVSVIGWSRSIPSAAS